MNMTEQEAEIILTYADCDMNMLNTGRILNYNHTSILYRLNKIRDKTGYDPRVFYDLVVLVQMAERIKGGV